jgi:pimeloyl-ACP methyl ester carboxylesterase
VTGPENGRFVVLLHGWGSSAELMRPIARMLDDTCRVLSIDLPGHGQTPPPPRAIGVEECAHLVGELVASKTKPPVTLVGHSNGGRISLFMASDDRFANLVDRLVLISPSGVRPKRKLKVRIKSLVARLLKAPFQVLPERMRAGGLAWLRDSIVWRMLGSSDYRALSGVMRDTFVQTVNYHLDDRLARISVPTLIFWGDRDRDVDKGQIDTLTNAISDAGVVMLEGAGHYGYLDDPRTVAAATRHFLGLEVQA